jgi:serine/threonine protein kinase
MAAPTTSQEFLELVRKSGVVEEKRLEAYLQKTQDAGALPEDLGKLAGILVRDAILTHFQAEQFLLGKWRRFTIGKYKVLERVGAGGMGSVYLCEHKFMRRRVAVKVLPMAKAEDSSALERFYREARAVAALDHPNIVRAYDIDQDDKLHFLVMEYVDGTNFQEIIKRHGPMDFTRAAHYIRQAALGLQHAFQTAGLIHRDIKPGNILVDRNGVVKVLDMGLARFFHDEEDVLTKKYDENVLGTADYLAPEQALDSHNVDIRADIYSLGATFYFCLTGNTPFTEGTVAQKLIWHQTRQPKKIRQLRPEVPEGMAAVVEKMMAKDPAHRYQSPADVVSELAPWTSEPIAPPPEEEMPRLSPAAMGPAGGDTPPMPPAPAPMTPSPVPQRVASGAPAASPRSPVPAPAGGSRKVVAATPRVSGPTSPSPSHNGRSVATASPRASLKNDTSSLSWDRPRSETVAAASVRVDTAPQSSRGALALLAAVPARQGLWIWVALGAGTLLLLLVLAIWLIFLHSSSSSAPSTAHAPILQPRVWKVTKEADEPGAFRTVAAALGQARAGDHILVLDERIEETLILETGSRGKNITIEAGAPGQSVRWLCPPNSEGRFVVLTNLEGFQLKGFVLDGQDHVNDLVVLRGKCPGLVLENLQLKGFTRSAVALHNCAAPGNDLAIRLQGLRATTTMQAPSALAFHVDPKAALPQNRNILICDCRLEGPFKSAIEFAGAVQDLKFMNNRITNCDFGFLYRKAIPYPPIRITMASNTFYNIRQAALHCEALPLAEQNPAENRIAVENNLFGQTTALVRVDEAIAPPRWAVKDRFQQVVQSVFPHPAGNVRDPSSLEGNVDLGAKVLPFSLFIDANNEAQFLRYPITSPLSQAGLNQSPVGVPPLQN